MWDGDRKVRDLSTMANGWLKGLKIAIVMAIAGLGYLAGWWDHLLGSPPTAHHIPITFQPELRSFRSKLDGWNDHQRIWEVAAEQIWQSTNDGSIHFETISRGLIFLENGRSLIFRGDWACWEKNYNRLLLGGNLDLRFDGNQLTTAELCMDYHKQILTASGDVVIRGEDLWLRAGRMIMDLPAGRIRLEQEVKWIQRGNELRGHSLEIDWVKERFELIEPEGLAWVL